MEWMWILLALRYNYCSFVAFELILNHMQDHMTPLLVAAQTGNYILVELLLSNNATIDQGDDVRRCMFTRYNIVMDVLYNYRSDLVIPGTKS